MSQRQCCLMTSVILALNCAIKPRQKTSHSAVLISICFNSEDPNGGTSCELGLQSSVGGRDSMGTNQAWDKKFAEISVLRCVWNFCTAPGAGGAHARHTPVVLLGSGDARTRAGAGLAPGKSQELRLHHEWLSASARAGLTFYPSPQKRKHLHEAKSLEA